MPNQDEQNTKKQEQDYEFIKEQILEKKRNHLKETLFGIAKSGLCAVAFGLVAALIFALAEPVFSKYFVDDEIKEKEQINLTVTPVQEGNMNNTGTDGQTSDGENADALVGEKNTHATLDDYIMMRTEIKRVAMKANKALVSVVTTKAGTDWMQNPIVQTITSTGLVVGNNGVELTILVGYDRVEGARKINVKFTDTSIIEATYLDSEPELNLAVITVKTAEIPEVIFDTIDVANFGESYSVSVGTPVIAVGSPNGYPNSMEDGIITSKGSYIYVTDNRLDLFQVDIDDNENGDGVIVNMKGEVIGIITRTLKEGKNENLCTIIGISKVIPIIERMVNAKPRIYFGVKTEDMTEIALKQNGLEVSGGIYINEVIQGSPAFDAGLKVGDIIISVNDVLMKTTSIFYGKISEFNPGDEIQVKYIRTSQANKDIQKLKVTLSGKQGK